MKSNIKARGKRAMSLIMVLIMVLGLLPAISIPAHAEDETGNSSGGTLVIELTTIYGDGHSVTAQGSISASALLSKKDDGSYVKEKTVEKIEMRIKLVDLLGQTITNDETIYYYWDQVGINPEPESDPFACTTNSDGSITCTFYMSAFPDDTVIYISANTGKGDNFTAASIDWKHLKEARSGIKYTRFGMQIRAIDGKPLGPNNYTIDTGAPDSKGNPQGTGSDWSSKTYVGLDGKTWDYSYHDVWTHRDEALDESGSILNLDDIQKWYEELCAADPSFVTTANTITVSGPAYILMYNGTTSGPRTNEVRANLQYYTKNGKNAANNYVSWGPGTRNDFIALRYMTMIIPIKQSGGIEINCYDEETNKLLYTKKISETELDKFQQYPQKADFESVAFGEGTPFREMIQIMAAASVGPDETWWITRLKDLKSLSKLERDPISGEIREKAEPIANEGTLKMLYERHQFLAKEYQRPTGAQSGTPLAKAITVADILFPSGDKSSSEYVKELNGYVLDFGLAKDAAMPAMRGYAVPILYKADPGMKVSVSQDTQTAVVDLYFLKAGAPYQIKIRLDGEIDEALTRSYPIRFDEEGNPLPVPEDDPTVEESEKLVK